MIENHASEGVATGDPEADALLREDPNALLLGVLFDQQMRAEQAFSGPLRLRERLGHLDMKQIAEMDLDKLQDIFGESPAVHRFYNMMAGRTQDLAQALTEAYDGNAAGLWDDGADLDEVAERAQELPGIGKGKASTLCDALTFFGHR